MGNSEFVTVVDKVDHDKLLLVAVATALLLLAWRLHDSGLVKRCRVGIYRKDDVAFGETVNDTIEHNDLLFGQVKDLEKKF